ncbi:MAG TPA: hypothetical protein VEQ58_06370, partial [Polyangiaceae bacterium]|nr:hypothetical protein [Polyangiaceae bacterium]
MGRARYGLLLPTATLVALGCAKPLPQRAAASSRAPAAPSPSALAAYCGGVSRRRAAFHPQLSFEVRAASLTAREGYEPRALSAAEQAIAGAPEPQLFLGREIVVSTADLDFGSVKVEPSGRDDGHYYVMLSAKSADSVAPRLQPLVRGTIAVLVDGHLVEFAHLQSANIRQWPIAMGLSPAEARDVVARFSPPPDAAALQALEAKCLDGDQALCRPLAEERLFGRDAPYNPEEANALFEAGCRLGDGRACKRAAELARKPEHRAELLERSCQLNLADACLELGKGLLELDNPADERARGKALLTRSCDLGGGKACAELAELLGKDGGDSPPFEQKQALVKLLERGCSGSDADSCFVLGQFAQRGA